MEFIPGVTPVPVHGSVIEDEDWQALHDAVDLHWLTAGPLTHKFEQALQTRFGRRNALFVNSGSSANLLALASLELPRGSEVITSACAFPTTVNPIIQLGLVPVFVDCEPGTWNIDTSKLEATPLTAKAMIITHTLGNPCEMTSIDAFCKRRGLRLIEDSCDSAGAAFDGKPVGSWGDFSTYSFYPAHQITTGEGGALLTDDPRLAKIAQSYRDWGRDCWCEGGRDNTCGKRFDGEYDHRYTYSRIGWNLKATDLQAALGCEQIKRLDEFVKARHENWQYLYVWLKDLPIVLPVVSPNSRPSWFGFAFGTEDRNELARYLDAHGVGNRPLFGGNILRHSAYKNIDCRAVGELKNANYAYEHVIWVGCWPGLTTEMLDYSVETIRNFFK
jgi:CDP-6-deoxy-D-xylo-4-hexulose-3-dehydrase